MFSFKCEHCDQGKAKKQRKTKKPRSKEAKKQITSNIKEAGSLESVFSLLLFDSLGGCE